MASFTSWSDIRDNLKDKIANYVAGSPITDSYEINGKTMRYRNIAELKELYELTYILADLDNAGEVSERISYGKYSNY